MRRKQLKKGALNFVQIMCVLPTTEKTGLDLIERSNICGRITIIGDAPLVIKIDPAMGSFFRVSLYQICRKVPASDDGATFVVSEQNDESFLQKEQLKRDKILTFSYHRFIM